VEGARRSRASKRKIGLPKKSSDMGPEKKRAIIIAVVCLLVALVLIQGYVKVRRDELTREYGEEVDVVVAATAIGEYELIRPGMVESRRVFKAFRQPQTVETIDSVIGKSAFMPIYPGEQIVLTKIIDQEGKPVLDRQIEKTMRAVTVSIAPHTGVSRLVRPGNHVDIMIIPNYDMDGTMIFEVKTMLQNVLVLATGKTIQSAVPTRINREVLEYLEGELEKRKRRDVGSLGLEGLPTSRPTDDYQTLTVMVSPDDAEKLHFVETVFGSNRMYLTLRNSADQAPERLETTLLDEVLGPDSDYGATKRKPPPLAPPPRPRIIDSVGGQPQPVY